MNTFFEVKVKYEKIDETGKEKKVSQIYLIDAVNNGDAEKKAHEQLEPYITGEFDVKGTKQANFSEIIPSDNGDLWFKCQVAFITIDEEKGKEKKTKVWMLVQANNCKEAYENIEEALKDTVSDYQIPKVSESPIVEVFTYFESSENKLNESTEWIEFAGCDTNDYRLAAENNCFLKYDTGQVTQYYDESQPNAIVTHYAYK